MTALFDSIGPSIGRASWQGALLAVLIYLLTRSFGERLAPRWRYLLWSLVVLRFVCVATPAAPWSAFNLVGWRSEPRHVEIARNDRDPRSRPEPRQSMSATQAPLASADASVALRVSMTAEESPVATAAPAADSPSVPDAPAIDPALAASAPAHPVGVLQIACALWLAGCLLFGLRLLWAAVILRRRLSACRPLTDAAILKQLEAVALRMGLKRSPRLLVTPEAISPCIAGTWNPRIVVPESLVAAPATSSLRHVLAHELAHIVRGDLWANWLVLAARVLHWFNPLAWWTVREMQAEREAACDELALVALGETDRSAYAATILDLAANLAPSVVAPGMIGLVSSARRLRVRIERLARPATKTALRTPFAAGLLFAIAVCGLTDAMPIAGANQPAAKKQAKTAPGGLAPDDAKQTGPQARTTLRGRCLDHVDKSPLRGVRVRLFKVEGRTAPIVEAASKVTDAEGNFEFANVITPRPDDEAERLIYLVFAEADDRPIGYGGTWSMQETKPNYVEIRMFRKGTSASGTVLNARGRPVAGASVMTDWAIDGRPVPGILSAATDAEGKFEIERIPDFRPIFPNSTTTFTVSHPDYLETELRVADLTPDLTITLPDGCLVTGTVADAMTGKPAAGALVLAAGLDEHREIPTATDGLGRFRKVLAEGRYNFVARAKDRVCVAITDRECVAGQRLELPPMALSGGGFISGRVVNTRTGKTVSANEEGRPIAIGLFGPSHPRVKVISPARLAMVDETGRFTLRAAPGENFPYFVNMRGDRMAWDTEGQPPVVVKEGETTVYDMRITPPVPAKEKLKAARELVESLPEAPAERTTRIVAEFQKLNHTVDEPEVWCTLMRDLVAIGPAAVPHLCAELDRADNDRLLRRLAFALRAIRDARAVPALIRALPRTLLPSSSDYGLIVEDRELAAFMQKHDLDAGAGGTYFGFGRPVREVCGALQKLTGQVTDDAELFGIHLSEDPRRQVLQRRMFVGKAQRWQAWWEMHWREWTDDPAYQKVNLQVVDEPLPPPAPSLGPNAKVVGVWSGYTLSPAIQGGQHASHFLDLDTGFEPKWPAEIPKNEDELGEEQLAEWAAKGGVDLMCVTHRAADGTETFVLRSFGMKVWEIGPRDLRNLDKLVAAGTLPTGREVGPLLMHYDADSQEFVPDANSAFLFRTHDGSLGLIETTDRITRTQNLTGLPAGSAPGGVGLFKGVQFNLKEIVP